MIKISNHAMIIARDRFRLSQEDFKELAQNARIYGVGLQYMDGKMRKYIERRYRGYANDRSEAIYYGIGIFIFINRFLITAYPAPMKYVTQTQTT